jgi:Arc/MetJ family transcription regulator
MKTLVDIDVQLLEKAMRLSQVSTKRETIHRALEEFIKLKSRERLKSMAGSGAMALSLHDHKVSRLKRERKQARLIRAGQ